MSKTYRPRRDLDGMKTRRLRAGKMFEENKTQADVVRATGVSRQSVSRWYKDFKRGGIKALVGAGRAGRKPRLSAVEIQKVDGALRNGAKGNGFGTDLWTLPRVATVIEKITGTRYHSGHVWRILRQLGWTLQRPAKQARERNDKAHAEWVNKRWPAIKKKPEN